MQAINQFGSQVESIPGYGIVSGYYNDTMAEHFSRDPFYEKIPKKDKSELKPHEKMEYDEVRRRAPQYITDKQRVLWKKIMKRAWYHDRNFCGCTPIDCGCGMVSIISCIPILGSIIAYKMHYKMIKMCHQAGCPPKILTAMGANATLDFTMTLVPLLGSLLSWMKASSTRNAGLFDDWLRGESDKHARLLESQKRQQEQLLRPPQAAATAPGRSDRPNGTQAPVTRLPRDPPRTNVRATPRAVNPNAGANPNAPSRTVNPRANAPNQAPNQAPNRAPNRAPIPASPSSPNSVPRKPVSQAPQPPRHGTPPSYAPPPQVPAQVPAQYTTPAYAPPPQIPPKVPQASPAPGTHSSPRSRPPPAGSYSQPRANYYNVQQGSGQSHSQNQAYGNYYNVYQG